MQLYKLTSQYMDILQIIDEGEVEDLQDTLEAITGEIEEKVDDIVKLMKSVEADEKALKEEEERLYNRRKALENKRGSIKTYLEGEMLKTGIYKLKTSLFSVGIQNNPPSVRVDETNEDLKKHSDVWVSHPDTLDKRKILDLLKKGEGIPGCEIVQTKSLRIR